jgi:hypothetical protein
MQGRAWLTGNSNCFAQDAVTYGTGFVEGNGPGLPKVLILFRLEPESSDVIWI